MHFLSADTYTHMLFHTVFLTEQKYYYLETAYFFHSVIYLNIFLSRDIFIHPLYHIQQLCGILFYGCTVIH